MCVVLCCVVCACACLHVNVHAHMVSQDMWIGGILQSSHSVCWQMSGCGGRRGDSGRWGGGYLGRGQRGLAAVTRALGFTLPLHHLLVPQYWDNQVVSGHQVVLGHKQREAAT